MITPQSFMVVDDDKANNFLCRAVIKKVFPEINAACFNEPKMGLDYIQKQFQDIDSPTVLFLDINMPDISGWDFLEKFKNFSDHIHDQFTIYILSSSIDQHDKDKAAENEFVSGFISKPLKKDTLKELFNVN